MTFAKKLEQNQPDTALWIAFKTGDKVAFEQLYKRYFAVLGRYGYRIVPQVTFVEDAIQDVFIDLWRRRENLSEVEQVKFYLFRAVRNQLLRNTKNDLFDGAETIDNFLDHLSTLSAEQQLIEGETLLSAHQSVQKAIADLSNRQREAVHLRFYQGMNLDEIAQLMGLTKQAVSNLLTKAYTILRLTLKLLSSFLLLPSSSSF